MSTDRVVLTCPVCSGDRTSVASKGGLYCVDCNRIYLVFESQRTEELALEPADDLREVRYHKRIA